MKKNKLFDSKGNPLYCIYPFYLFFVHISYCSICCWISTDENIDFNKKKNLLDVWFSEKFDKIRNSIRDLSYSECDLKYCRPLYSTENIHFDCFKSLTEIRRMYPEIADYLEGKTDKFRGLPRHILNGFDNSCNLACKSCNASKINKQSKITGRKYIEQIEKIGENVNTLEISCFGDPFGSPVYREWLFNFNDSRFPKLKKIQILTNGILWTEKNWKKVSDNVKKYNIEGRISIDGATKETYEYNRGAKFEILIKNLEFIVKLRKRNEINELNLNFVVQQNNYKEIPLIIDFAKKYSFDSIALVKIGNWGLYKDEDFEKINIFNNKHPEYKTFKNLYQKIKISKNNGIDVEFRFEL